MYPSATFPSQGIFVQQQIKGLRAAGLEVRVLLVDRWGKGPLVYYHWLRNAVQSAVAEFEPDVIHVMYGGVMADQIARRHHIRPVVVSFRGSDLLGENLSGWTRKFISRYGTYCSRRAAKAADAVIVVASHLASALAGAVPADKIHVIPSGIDLDRFNPADPLACKQKLGLDPRSFHVLFASNNGDPVKRPWLAKAAVEQISHRSRPVEFHYLTGIPGPEMPHWLNAGDALLLTSLHEGSPNVVKEALACGLPVVSVNVGDVAERIKGIEGCHLAAAEPAELAAKLDLVWQRGGRLNCRAQLEDLSIQSIAQKLKQVYGKVTREYGEKESRKSKDRISSPAVCRTKDGSDFSKQGMQPKYHDEPMGEMAPHQPAPHA